MKNEKIKRCNITLNFKNVVHMLHFLKQITFTLFRDRSRTASTPKMELFVIIVNGWKPLTIITKRSILDVAAVLDPPLLLFYFSSSDQSNMVE